MYLYAMVQVIFLNLPLPGIYYNNQSNNNQSNPDNYFNERSWIFKIHKKIVSLTELMAGVKAPSKTCQLFQLMCWPQGYKVPTSTNALVELMNMVERWRQRTDYGPVVVVSQDGIGRQDITNMSIIYITDVNQMSDCFFISFY